MGKNGEMKKFDGISSGRTPLFLGTMVLGKNERWSEQPNLILGTLSRWRFQAEPLAFSLL